MIGKRKVQRFKGSGFRVPAFASSYGVASRVQGASGGFKGSTLDVRSDEGLSASGGQKNPPHCRRINACSPLASSIFKFLLLFPRLSPSLTLVTLAHFSHLKLSLFLFAIIAVARKVIILDLKSLPAETLLGISAVIAALSGGFFLIKRALKH